MRIKKIENDIIKNKAEAVAKAKKGDKRAAAQYLRKAKMYEAQLPKLEGQILMLQQQQLMIEGAVTDQKVFTGLKAGKDAINQLQSEMNIDKMEDLQDEIKEQMDQQEEIGQFFSNAVQEDADEINEELDALIAEDVEAEMA